MSVEKILNDWKKKTFRPVYWLEGEEDYYIDQVMSYAEHHILNEAEAGFNLTVFYGKDAAWADIVNACMRYPMFAERQVVLLKEAQDFPIPPKDCLRIINCEIDPTLVVVAEPIVLGLADVELISQPFKKVI